MTKELGGRIVTTESAAAAVSKPGELASSEGLNKDQTLNQPPPNPRPYTINPKAYTPKRYPHTFTEMSPSKGYRGFFGKGVL